MPTHTGTAMKDGKKVKITIRDKRPKKIEKPEKPKRKVTIVKKDKPSMTAMKDGKRVKVTIVDKRPKKSKMEINELVELIEDDRKSPVGKMMNDDFPDYIEMFLDGRGRQEKQLERASAKASRYLTRQVKKAIKLGKIKSLEEFNKIYNTKSKARDLLDDV